MPDCNSATCVGGAIGFGGPILLSTGCTRRISCWFSLSLASYLLLCCAWLNILIVSSVSTTGCLWLIGCWALPIIVCSRTHSSTICRLVSAAYWLRVMSSMGACWCIWSIIWVCAILLLSIHCCIIFNINMEVGFSVSYPWLWILYYIEIINSLF